MLEFPRPFSGDIMAEWHTGTRATFVKPAADVVSRQLGGGAVLIDLESNQIFELNESATWIWRRLAAGVAVPDVVAAASGASGGHADAGREEAEAFVDALRGHGLVEPDDRRGSGDTRRASSEAHMPEVELSGPWTPPRLRAAGTVTDIIKTGGAKLPAC
jgi:hypothetical protein